VSWSNPMLALAFRPYWESVDRLFGSWRDEALSKSAIRNLIDDCNEKWKHLIEMFESEANYIKRSDAF
jgi:hypothetical protein